MSKVTSSSNAPRSKIKVTNTPVQSVGIHQPNLPVDINTTGPPYLPIHPDIKHWDDLPSSKLVSLPVVCAMLGVSPATVWRRVKQGLLANPHRRGKRCSRWSVGQIREALMAE